MTNVGELQEALASANGEPVLILGGGSNLVVRDGFASFFFHGYNGVGVLPEIVE